MSDIYLESPTDVPDILDLNCPTRLTLDLISSLWTVLVIHVLSDGTKRYGVIKTLVQGITHKMLAQTLRALERDGLVTRHVYPIIPPKVDYTLTPLGMSLVPILNALCRWSEENYEQVQHNRQIFTPDNK